MTKYTRYLICFAIMLGLTSSPAMSAVRLKTKYRGFSCDKSITSAEIRKLASYKVNLVYFFFDPLTVAKDNNATSYLEAIDTELQTLDVLLADFAANGIQVALNLYSPPGGFVDKESPALHHIFQSEDAQGTLIKAWEKIASHLKGNPAIWGYNLVNEPAQRSVAPGLMNWKLLSATLVDTIRAIDHDVRIIIQPVYGDPNRFSSVPVIKRKGNVTYAFNMYYPYKFTHQGLYGIALGRTYPARNFKSATLLRGMVKAFQFRKKHQVPMYVPEFTAVRWSPGDSSFRYLKDVLKLFEIRGIDWTYHTYGGTYTNTEFAFPWSVDHTSDPMNFAVAENETNRLKLLRSYFRKNRR